MACEVNSTATIGCNADDTFNYIEAPEDPVFDLSAVIEHNTDFNAVTHDSSDGVQQLEHYTAASPIAVATGGLNEMLAPQPGDSCYPADFGSAPSTPYFQSIEQPTPQPPYGTLVPSPLRHQYLHRRSVSEPPDGALVHHQRQYHQALPPPTVTFHRDGYDIGEPRHHTPVRRVGAKKGRHLRLQPYRSPPSQGRGKPNPAQHRRDLRHAHTEPMLQIPTSVPGYHVPFQPTQSQQQLLQQPCNDMPFNLAPEKQCVVSSRICTPEPQSGPSVVTNSPQSIDPSLGGSETHQAGDLLGMVANSSAPGTSAIDAVQNAVLVKLGVDDLRAIITDAVQKAVENLDRRLSKDVKVGVSSAGVVDATSDRAVEEDENEEAVSAPVTSGTNSDGDIFLAQFD